MAEPRVAGIVLAGGRSSRMGVDKASLMLEGRTLLQRTIDVLDEVADEVIVVAATGQELPQLESAHPLRVVEDAIEGQGPLVGIAAGLEAMTAPVAVVVACDMPYLRPALLRLLAERAAGGARLAVPMHDGWPQPLCSAWQAGALAVVRAHVEAGDRTVMSVAGDLDAERMPPEAYVEADADGRSFINLNPPDEFKAALAAR